MANGILVAALVVDVRRAPRADSLDVRRSAPTVMTIGREAPVSLLLRNPTGRRLTVTLRDAAPPSGARRPKVHRDQVPARTTTRLDGRITPERRGSLALGPLTVRTAGPLGLGGRQSTLGLVDMVKVYPSLPGRSAVELRVERARLLQSGQRSSRYRGGGTDFDSLRDYHHDDEFRRINWVATARAAKPITNVYREERNQQVVLMLDASRAMAGTVAGVSRFEHALDAAMAVAELAARVGDHVGMITFSSRVHAMLAPRGGRAQPGRILEALFDGRPTLDAADYRGAFGRVLSHHRRRSLLVLFTEVTEESAMESLFAALPVLLRRHLLVLGAVVDPALVALRAAAPESFEETYLAAAAAEALSARDRASARLRAMGVMVEDREPGLLAGGVADRYLQIKSAGRL